FLRDARNTGASRDYFTPLCVLMQCRSRSRGHVRGAPFDKLRATMACSDCAKGALTALQTGQRAADTTGVTPRVDAEYSRWLQRTATTSVLIYSGLIAVFLPAFYFLLTPLPG